MSSKTLSLGFRLKVNGIEVEKYSTTGVKVEFGSEWEWHEAARFGLLSWPEFCLLDGDSQSEVVAHYRAHKNLETAIREASKNG